MIEGLRVLRTRFYLTRSQSNWTVDKLRSIQRSSVTIIGTQLTGVAVATLIACEASAQTPSRQPAAAAPLGVWLGVWRGTSTCLVRPSACNDETVVYRITQTSVDSVAFDGRKIVRGEEQEMGVLGCRLVPQIGQLTCAIPQATWRFTVRGDSLVGELRLADNTRFREVRTVRAR